LALRRDLWRYVRELRLGGTTIVLTTHYLEEAEELADRVAVVDHGKLVCLDSTGALLARFGRKQIRVTLGAPLGPPGAPALPGWLRDLGATLDRDGRVITCPFGIDPPGALLARLAALDPPVIDVETEKPSLERVFWQLTGHGAAAP